MKMMRIALICGFAAAQGGKALPYRVSKIKGGYASDVVEAQPLINISRLSERQSLSALCGGKAARS